MYDDLKKLYKLFCGVKEKGWVKSMRKGPTGIGYTFESLINKPEENFPIPDFNSIEIKTMHKYGRGQLHLFNATPDGDYLFPLQRILDKLGYPDKTFPMSKIFNMNATATEYTKVGYYKKIKLYVNYYEKKIDLIGYNISGRPIPLNISWSFDMLKQRINQKLKYLAIIRADSKILDNVEYFHYNYIEFFQLRSFRHFIELIEDGIIVVTFKIGVFKSGNRMGQNHDHGTEFSINYENIDKLYNRM